ncbi:UNVERIFIED_CONTAM: hypothetical protein FKN15_001371 [Acipenser sinensis]
MPLTNPLTTLVPQSPLDLPPQPQLILMCLLPTLLFLLHIFHLLFHPILQLS